MQSSDALLDDFMDEYAKRYGKGSIVLGTPVEFVGLRAIGIGRTIQASVGTGGTPAVETGTLAVPVGTRKVRLARGADGIVEVDVYDGAGLSPGHELNGAGAGRFHGHHGLGSRGQQRQDRRARHVHHGSSTMRTTTTEVSR